LAAAHFGVFPTLSDGFGLAIAEAIASGLPLAVTDRSAAPELLGGLAGKSIVPPRSPASIVERIEAVLDDPQGAVEEAAQAAHHVADHFGADRYARSIGGIYRNLLAEAQRPATDDRIGR
jgi:alpha-1,3-rhamnosyl/mannosyltransferase